MNKHQKIALLILNVLLFLELCLALYFGSKDPENLTTIFLKYFLFLIIPTFIIGWIVIKRVLRTKETQHTGVVETPNPEIQPLPHIEEQYYYEAPATQPLARVAEIENESRKRGLIGKVAAFSIIILSLSLLDSCVARFRQPVNVLNLLPGVSTKINGPLNERVKGVNELTYMRSSDLIQLSITRIYSGFWFGGTEWSGLLTVSPDTRPGEHRFMVFPQERKSEKLPVTFIVNVHPDTYSIRQSSKSFIKRNFGISPWWAIAGFFCMAVLTTLTVFLRSKKIEKLRAKDGQAEVYLVREGVTGTGIAFGLGARQGVRIGDRFSIFDESGKPAGIVVVQNASETDSVGIVGPDCAVRPGYIVSIKKD